MKAGQFYDATLISWVASLSCLPCARAVILRVSVDQWMLGLNFCLFFLLMKLSIKKSTKSRHFLILTELFFLWLLCCLLKKLINVISVLAVINRALDETIKYIKIIWNLFRKTLYVVQVLQVHWLLHATCNKQSQAMMSDSQMNYSFKLVLYNESDSHSSHKLACELKVWIRSHSVNHLEPLLSLQWIVQWIKSHFLVILYLTKFTNFICNKTNIKNIKWLK